VVLKESQEGLDPFVFSSLRFLVAAAVFSPFMRRALRDERVVKAGVEIGVWAAGGARVLAADAALTACAQPALSTNPRSALH
jgi:drug/metabolite transporter (DMT)-like permease